MPDPTAERRTLFVSHANPADNEFTRWIVLRLVREGYEVYSDLTDLLGGTDWWSDIEECLRQRTAKLIFVVSRTSNHAGGCLKELAVADGVKTLLGDREFIIPVKIDDLPYREHNIYINSLMALTFTKGWAEGLADLLKTLCEQDVPKGPASGPGVVAGWWNDTQTNAKLVRDIPQQHVTNWFPIRSMPSSIWSWQIPRSANVADAYPWPAYRVGDRLLSFAGSKALTGRAASPTGGRGMEFVFSLVDDPPRECGLDRKELRTAVRQLLRQAWDRVAEARNLPLYQLSGTRRSLWFPSGSVPPNGVPFVGIDGVKTDRQLYGFKGIGPKGQRTKRFYHYGLEAWPVVHPELFLALKSHVIFTLDGNTVHGDDKYQHRCRRSQCKAWWNDRWRDLLYAAVAALAKGRDEIDLPLCPGDSPKLATKPVEVMAPKSYLDDDVKEPSLEEIASDDDGDNEPINVGDATEAAEGVEA